MEYCARSRAMNSRYCGLCWPKADFLLCGSALRIYILIILRIGIVCVSNRGAATGRDAFFCALNLSLRTARRFLACLIQPFHFFLAFLKCRRHFGSPLKYETHYPFRRPTIGESRRSQLPARFAWLASCFAIILVRESFPAAPTAATTTAGARATTP